MQLRFEAIWTVRSVEEKIPSSPSPLARPMTESLGEAPHSISAMAMATLPHHQPTYADGQVQELHSNGHANLAGPALLSEPDHDEEEDKKDNADLRYAAHNGQKTLASPSLISDGVEEEKNGDADLPNAEENGHRRTLARPSAVSELGEEPVVALVVGNYCHDTLKFPSSSSSDSSLLREALGGSVSYIANIFDALGLRPCVVSKVGSDFAYLAHVRYPPQVVYTCPTTAFFADLTLGHPRILLACRICETILPEDIPFSHDATFQQKRYAFGLAVGVAGEIIPPTLLKMASLCRCLLVDVQALIRTIDPSSGIVGLQRLELTGFHRYIDKISFLKASSEEVVFLNVEDVRRKTCLIVTQGELGCTIYTEDSELRVPAFPSTEIDPTGAGDSFLAGFVAGLYQGLSVEEAALMGNYFGGIAVSQVGVPRFTPEHLKNFPKNRNGHLIEGIKHG